jgi:hypothetical protein
MELPIEYMSAGRLSLRLWITSARVVDCVFTIVASSTIDVRLMIKASRCDGTIFQKYMSAWSILCGWWTAAPCKLWWEYAFKSMCEEVQLSKLILLLTRKHDWSYSHLHLLEVRSYIHNIDFAPTRKRDWYIFGASFNMRMWYYFTSTPWPSVDETMAAYHYHHV